MVGECGGAEFASDEGLAGGTNEGSAFVEGCGGGAGEVRVDAEEFVGGDGCGETRCVDDVDVGNVCSADSLGFVVPSGVGEGGKGCVVWKVEDSDAAFFSIEA